ncbi:MAG: DUF7901 domain-containing protein, partial [Planctomycetota bacterium]
TNCLVNGGIPQGPGTTCTQPEACCLPDGTCADVDPLCCDDLGGIPQGPGTFCTQPEACCLPDGSCVDVDPLCCDDLGGVPQGPGTVCTAPEACCLQDGSCIMTDPLCCDDLGGTTSPFSNVCLGDGNGNGVDDACEQPQPPQACCLPDGTCAVMTHNQCVTLGGDPQGPAATTCTGIVCSPIKWAQPPTFNPQSPHPECFWGWDELSWYASPLGIMADDWPCTTDLPVADLHWWGSYIGWNNVVPPPIAPDLFHIGIWTDVPAGVDQSFSHPGFMIWEWLVPRSELNERSVACDFHPDYMDDVDGCFKYDFRIDPELWFFQDEACNIFWVSIAALYGAGPGCPCNGDFNNNGVVDLTDVTLVVQHQGCPVGTGDPLCDQADVNCDGAVDQGDLDVMDCQFAAGFPDPTCCELPVENPWGWKTREHMFMDDAIRILAPTAPALGMPFEFGEPITDLEQQTWDLAFVITTAQCPVADTPDPEIFSTPCGSDADCSNTAVCIGGDCYAPRNKYLGFSAGNTGLQVALRVTLSQSDLYPGMVGSSWWVQAHDAADPVGVHRLGCTPYYQDWSTGPAVIHVTAEHITSQAEYDVQAIALGCPESQASSYSPPLTLPTTDVWGDVAGGVDAGVSQPPDGTANLGDVQLIIKRWQGESFAPPINWCDIDGDPPNAIVNLADAFAAVIAFQGGTYPYGGPVPCP